MSTNQTSSTAQWIAQGPAPLTNSPSVFIPPDNEGDGAIHTVLADPTDEDILYVGAVNGGVWKTTNAKDYSPDWEPLTDKLSLPVNSIGAMAFDRNNPDKPDTVDPDTIIVGTGNFTAFIPPNPNTAGQGGNGPLTGLWLTTDAGKSFTKISDFLLDNETISGVAKHGNLILAVSNDVGNDFDQNSHLVRYAPVPDRGGVFRSNDNGQTWSRLPATTFGGKLPDDPYSVFDLVEDPSNYNRFYVSVREQGIFRSDDGGVSWVNISKSDSQLNDVITAWRQTWQEDDVGGQRDDGDRFGEALATGDFNNDGYADLAIGTPGDEAGSGRGEVTVLLGSSNGLTTAGYQTWQEDDVGGQRDDGDRFGEALATGDFNNDGYADLAIGTPGDEAGSGRGEVTVLLGSSNGLTTAGYQTWQEDDVGGQRDDGDRFGEALATGDFNNDGYADLAIGTPGDEAGSGRGEVTVLLGSSNGLTTAGYQTWQEDDVGGQRDDGDRFGEALATGDFNNDGYADLAIGTPGDEAGSGRGEVTVLLGSSNGLTTAGYQTWQEDDVGGQRDDGDRFGEALATGDFNNDGYADLAIGTPGDEAGSGRGEVTVLLGSSNGLTTAGYQTWQEDDVGGQRDDGDRFGEALATGDFNNDGYADLAIGTPGDEAGSGRGEVTVLLGSSNGLTTAGYQTWQEDDVGGQRDDGDRFGEALATGDFNNDGYADLAIGTPGDEAGSGRGEVTVLLGSSNGLTTEGRQTWQEDDVGGQRDPGDRFGEALATGDFNNNGYADLAIGTPGEEDARGKVTVLQKETVDNNNIEMAVAKDGRLYVAVLKDDLRYLGFTEDQGNQWSKVAVRDGLTGGQGYQHFSIVADPKDPEIVYVGGQWFTFRVDTSSTAVTPSESLVGAGAKNGTYHHVDSREMVFDAKGDLIQVDDGGIYRRTSPQDNTGDWSSLNGNLQVTEVNSADYDSRLNVIAAGTHDNGSAIQVNPSNLQWKSTGGGDAFVFGIDDQSDANHSYHYMYTYGGVFDDFIRQKYSSTTQPVETAYPDFSVVLPNGNTSSLPSFENQSLVGLRPIVLNSVDPTQLLFGTNYLYESANGVDIRTVNNSLKVDFLGDFDPSQTQPDPTRSFGWITALAYGGMEEDGNKNEDVIYAGASNGKLWIREGKGDPKDGDFDDFREVLAYQGSIETKVPIDIELDPSNWETAYIVDSADEVTVITRAGQEAKDITANLKDFENGFQVNPASLEYIEGPGNTNMLALGTNRGVFAAFGNDTTWSQWFPLGINLPNVPVFDLNYDSADDVLVAGTVGRGVWTLQDVNKTISPFVLLDFDEAGFGSGDRVKNQYADLPRFGGLEISAERTKNQNGDRELGIAMIFDSENPTGGDFDLKTETQGNVLIISEDGKSNNPDDNKFGGQITFDWDDPVRVYEVGLLDIDKSEGVGFFFYGEDGDLIHNASRFITEGDGNNQLQTFDDFADVDIYEMRVVLGGTSRPTGSGSITHVGFGLVSDQISPINSLVSERSADLLATASIQEPLLI
jgi:hypothetical protein